MTIDKVPITFSKNNKPKIVVIGLGGLYQHFEACIWSRFEVVALLDNNPSKFGLNVNGIKVDKVNHICQYECELIFITSMYSAEILTQLHSVGINNNKVKCYFELFPFLCDDYFVRPEFQKEIVAKWSVLSKEDTESKLNILFVINSLVFGGVEHSLINLINIIPQDNFNITLLVLFPLGELFSLVPEHVNLIVLFDNVGMTLDAMLYLAYESPANLYERLVLKDFDVEIAYIEGLSTKLVSASKCLNKIAWVHTDFSLDHWSNCFYKVGEERECYLMYPKIVFVSNNIKFIFLDYFCLPSNSRYYVIYNFVDEIYVREKAMEVVNGHKKNDLLLVSVGRLHPVKGYSRLISAVANLRDEGINCSLWLIGDGIERPNLELMIKNLNLERYVFIYGHQSNPYKYMSFADIYVSSSYAESYGLSIVEAMMLSKPIIATKTAGSLEILGQHEYGYLVDNNESDLIEGLRVLLIESELRNSYAKLSIEAAKKFSKTNNLPLLISLISNV